MEHYSEDLLVAALEVDCGDHFEAHRAWREERLAALLAALAPVGNVGFVVRHIGTAGPGDAPARHWAVRLANECGPPDEVGELQTLLVVDGVPFTPVPPVLWWSTAEVLELKRRRLIHLAAPTRYRPGKRCYELGAPAKKQRKQKAGAA